MVKAQLNSQDQVNAVVNAFVVANVVVRDVVAICADSASKASKGLHLWSKRRTWQMHRAYQMYQGRISTSIPTPGTTRPGGERCCFEGSLTSCALGSTGLISRLNLIAS